MRHYSTSSQSGAFYPAGYPPRTRSAALRLSPSSAALGYPVAFIVAFLGFHLLLAFGMKKVSTFAAIHALITLIAGLYIAASKPRAELVGQWAAYVVGAEVLWRMCRAPIPWEFAKYSIWLVALFWLFRWRRWPRTWLPLVYLCFLLPAAIPTLAELSPEDARQAISFNLSGPLCLACCGLCASQMRLSPGILQRFAVTSMAPVSGIAFLAFFRMATTQVTFSSGSTVAASGGYGPNQVSAMLSLGAVFAMFAYAGEDKSKLLRMLFAGVGVWFLGQAALTFSRTGIYLFGAAFCAAAVFLVRWKGRGSRIIVLVSLFAMCCMALLPLLNAFTGGKLANRYNDKGLTGRDNIAELDLEIFREHPLIGVGAGMSVYERREVGDEHAAHTEYTRLLADHGSLGAMALLVLCYMSFRVFLQAPGAWGKAIVAAFAVWAFLFMAVSAMRLAAPSLLLGLIHARFVSQGEGRVTLLRRKNG